MRSRSGSEIQAVVTFLASANPIAMEFNGAMRRYWAAIPLRLIVGYGFLEHGMAKILKGPDHFIVILHALGVPAAPLMGWVSILTEIFGGLAVLAGAFVAYASVPMAAMMIVAMFTVHLPYGFSSIKLMAVTAAGPQFGTPGYEVNLLYLACLAALVLGGAGPFSVDGWRGRGKPLDQHA